MADTLNNITNFINSPQGQLAAGAALAGIVWKAFDRWESVADEDDKIQIWMWLAQPALAKKVESWPETFARLFDRVFGQKHLSWKCFFRSCLATLGSCFIGTVIANRVVEAYTNHGFKLDILRYASLATVLLFAFAYVSLLETRYVLDKMGRSKTFVPIVIWLVVDLVATGITGFVPYVLMYSYQRSELLRAERENMERTTSQAIVALMMLNLSHHDTPEAKSQILNRAETEMKVSLGNIEFVQNTPVWRLAGVGYLMYWLPTFFPSIWLWLYASSGFLLKSTRRFDIGFAWLNRHFDIEHKPIQVIGFVSGAILACVYWAAVIVKHFV